MGRGGAGRGTRHRQADPAVGRLRHLPLVPRDGARKFRRRTDRRADEPAVRLDQGRPRGAARHRPFVYVGAAPARRAGRLAADDVPDIRRRPILGRNLFPPEPRWGRPSFRQVLQAVADAYERGHEMVGRNTEALRAALVRMSATRPGEGIGPPQLDAAAAALLRSTDPEHGGLRGAPKFPNPPIFRFLLQNDFRTGGQDGRTALHLLLEHMSQGGIYDHLGGGYARYSTDAIWLVPHFEKMLYDNAQLLELLAFAHADRPSPLYAERAEETVGWLLRDMRATKGAKAAFASS